MTDGREPHLRRLALDLHQLEGVKRREERRHLGIGLTVVVLVFLAINEAWGPGLIVLVRDLVMPLVRTVK